MRSFSSHAKGSVESGQGRQQVRPRVASSQAKGGFKQMNALWTDTREWGVLPYKSVADFNVTTMQPRDLNSRCRTFFVWLNFFKVYFARVKNFPFNFFVFQKETEKKHRE